MKNIFSLLLTLISSTLMGYSAEPSFDYTSKWNVVDNLIDKPLLKYAQKKVDEIRVVAQKENNELNTLRCEIYDFAIDLGCEYNITAEEKRLKPNNAKREEAEDIIINHYKKASDLQKALKSPVEKACCELFMATMVKDFIDVMDRRPGSVPSIKEEDGKQFTAEDLREMSHENLRGIIRTHVDNVVKEKDILLSTSADEYRSMFVVSKQVTDEYKEYNPSVFDAMLPSLIMFYYEQINILENCAKIYLPIHLVQKDLLKSEFLNSVFADVINNHYEAKEYSAALSAELTRLQYLERANSFIDNKTKIETLESLIKQYDGKTSCVVNAAVKKQELMCNEIMEFNSGDESKKIDAYPKQIIEETAKYEKLYPTHSGISQLKQNIDWLKKTEASGTVKARVNKGKEVSINAKYANIDTLHVYIYRVDMTPLELADNDHHKEIANAKFIAQKEIKLSPSNYIIKKDTVINIGNDFDYGRYIVYFNNKKSSTPSNISNVAEKGDNNYVTFNVSDISLLDVTSVGTKRNIFVINGETGHPVKDATVERYSYIHDKYNLQETVSTNVDGQANVNLSNNNSNKLFTRKGKDIYSPSTYIDKHNSYEPRDLYKIGIYTDRETYRPGQTVQGKIVLSYLSKEDKHIAENKNVNLIFKDANYETIDEINVTTNEFGSAPFDFTIPSDRMNGSFSIQASFNDGKLTYYDGQNIMVESYKLPVAEAKVNVKEGSSTMYGSKLEFEGEIRTFSGESVNGTTVKYRLEEFGYHYGRNAQNVLFSGEIKCSDDGKFTIVTDSAITKELANAVKLIIDAVLPSGETVTASQTVIMDDKPVSGVIICHLNTFEKKSPLNLTVNLQNNAKYNNDAEAIIAVATKEDKDKGIASKEVLSKIVRGNGSIKETLGNTSLEPAVYDIVLRTAAGEKLATEQIIIFDKTSSKLPEGFESMLSKISLNIECSPNKNAEIMLLSSEKEAKVLAVVRDEKGKFLNHEWIDMNREQKIFRIPFNKYFANNKAKTVSVEFIIVRNDKIIRHSETINREESKEKQEIEILEIVRNIVPGEKQKVKIKVKPTSDRYEIAAVMVDRSLPGMVPSWSNLSHFTFYQGHWESNIPYVYTRPFNIKRNVSKGRYQHVAPPQFIWNNINMREGDIFTTGYNRYIRAKAAPRIMRSMAVAEAKNEVPGMAAEVSVQNDMAVAPTSAGSTENSSDAIDFSDVKVRDNFVETAFFYPQLVTKEDGSVEFEYTAPDALTSWTMILLAHDKKVNSCVISEELQTKMPFAVKANLPRFVRKGDKCTLATTITNNDDKEKSGDVAIIIKDIATDKVILEQSRKFSVAGNQSKVEEWSFNVPAGVAAIEVKMVGKSGTFSDGEVHTLPVLSDGTHVVKSKSMHVRGGETKDFSIQYNEKEMQDAELTVEYTDNAVWQALMALPSVKDAKYECATEFISVIYANQMAQRIAKLYPEIQNVVEEWKKEGNHAASPLEQNQELKNVLMQQTPWMCEAKNESEQRAKIVELYDNDRIAKANKDAISKLEKLQNSDGGFSWFAGFKSSEYVTVAVARRLVELKEYGVLPKDCEKMLKNAVKYIDKALAEAYKNEIGKNWNADREWVFNVFRIRISYDKNLDNDTKKILDYYVNKARKKVKEMTLFGKASFALVLKMKGDEKEAKSIVESLRQSATDNEELGMYWKGNQDSWGRYGNAIATHAMLIKAFQTTGCDAKELSDLRFHLITKKETTQWSNTESTLAAIDALVGDGNTTTDLRKSSNRTIATIKIGGKTIDAKRTSGDGYVKVNYDKESFTPELCNNIHIEQPAGQEGIGGIYISYDAPYSEITSGKSGIEVKKKMYKVVIANDGDNNKEMLQEIKEGEKLKKGDKVKIVMTLRSDRDIDFVQVLDLRAACLEPVRKRPGIKWADGKVYYQSITDSEYSMFFDRISKGTRVFEYTLHVTQSGEYTQGITKVIPHYCPAFSANSEGGMVVVE